MQAASILTTQLEIHDIELNLSYFNKLGLAHFEQTLPKCTYALLNLNCNVSQLDIPCFLSTSVVYSTMLSIFNIAQNHSSKTCKKAAFYKILNVCQTDKQQKKYKINVQTPFRL